MVHSNLSLDLGSTAEESHADQAEELCSLTRLRSVPLRSCSLTKPSPLRKLYTDEAEVLTAEELLTNETITAVELYLRSFAPSHLRTFAPSHLRTFAHLPKS